MTGENRKKLELAGMNVETALERFMGNEALLTRFLKKFIQDKSYQDLVTAIENRDVDGAFAAAHTLKGVSANFSMDTLFHAVGEQTEALRNKDLETGIKMMPEVTKQYENMISVINEVLGE